MSSSNERLERAARTSGSKERLTSVNLVWLYNLYSVLLDVLKINDDDNDDYWLHYVNEFE